MRKLLLLALVVTMMFTLAPTAQAVVRYDSRFTSRNGWIVIVQNDSRWSRVRCHWSASGTYWHTNWLMRPFERNWTTSDAGNWGDRRPRNLDCTFVRV